MVGIFVDWIVGNSVKWDIFNVVGIDVGFGVVLITSVILQNKFGNSPVLFVIKAVTESQKAKNACELFKNSIRSTPFSSCWDKIVILSGANVGWAVGVIVGYEVGLGDGTMDMDGKFVCPLMVGFEDGRNVGWVDGK